MGPSPTALGKVSAAEAEGLFVPARLGERLAARGLISADAIEDVLERQRRRG